MFEKASNSQINIKKTKIYGIGNWCKRINWPINGLKTEIDYFCTLGIIFSNDYDTALHANWRKIYDKIKIRFSMMLGRNLNIYQKAIIINSLISSKIWYTSHVYPLPIEYSKLINTEIFKFIWNSNSNPIKREVINRNKDKGGLGLLNIYYKAKSIFISTTLRNFLTSKENSIIRYCIANKINNILGIRNNQIVIRNKMAPFYEYAIDGIKLCKKIDKFPKVDSKIIYKFLLPDTKPSIEAMYPNYSWNNIWKTINFKYIAINDRPILYKYCHEILTTNKRLYQIRIRDNPLCDICDMEESNIHKFYFCPQVQDCLLWLKKVIYYLCGLNCNSLLKILSFDFPNIENRNKNTLCIIISNYIACTWYNRENLVMLTNKLKAKMIFDQKIKLEILGNKANKVFSENYCKAKIEDIGLL